MAKLTIGDLPMDQELDKDAMREIAGGARNSGRGELIGGLGTGSTWKRRGSAGNRFGQGRNNRFRKS